MWEFYLAYCEAGFRVGYLDVFQFSLARPDDRTGTGRRRAARRAVERLLGAPLPGPDPGVGRHPRQAPPTAPSWSSGTAGRCGACCGAPASWGSRGRSWRVTWTSRATSPTGSRRFWTLAKAHHLPACGPSPREALARRPAGAAARRGRAATAAAGVGGPADGRLHTRRRDRAAIAHHYDLSNDFYAFLLDPQMAYSCGYWTQEASPSYGLVDAQRDKLDLICRKLALRPGMRLLDVGCGWASLLVHAAAALRRAGHGRDALGAAAGVRAGQGRGAGPRRPRRDPVAGLPRARRRAVRRSGVDRDGRARRRAQLPGVRRPAAPRCCSRTAGSCCSRCREGQPGRTTRRAAARSWSATSRPTCTCARSAPRSACWRRQAWRSWTSTRCASTTCGRCGPGSTPSRSAGRRPWRWSARSSGGCGCSTSRAGCWRSRRAGWACTRSSWCAPTSGVGRACRARADVDPARDPELDHVSERGHRAADTISPCRTIPGARR